MASPLVGPLRFGLDPQGDYVVDRTESTSYSNVNLASPAGVKAITLSLGSASQWCDPSSVLISMTIRNKHATNALWPATCGAHCLFQRLQVYFGSTEVENLEGFGKITEALTKLSLGPAKRLDMARMGFGVDIPAQHPNLFLDGQHNAKKIPGHGSKKIYMKLDMSGVFSQHRWIPLFALGGQGLRIVLTLAEKMLR